MQALSEWQERALHAHAHAQTLGRQRRDRLAELVALAAEQIVATSDPAALFARAAKAIEHIVADSSPVHLRVHPADLAAARSAFDEAALGWRETGRAVRLLVNADATLEPGACVIETDLGALDASLSLQLAAMREAVARAVRSVPEEDFAGDEAAADAGGHAYGEDVPDFEHAGGRRSASHGRRGGRPLRNNHERRRRLCRLRRRGRRSRSLAARRLRRRRGDANP
ncbi:MAG: FliH/SctL family protein [Pararobbsia sp.]